MVTEEQQGLATIGGDEHATHSVPVARAPTTPASVAHRRDWRDTTAAVDGVVKLTVVATAVVYVLGLLIVNSYLFRLGLTDFGMVRPRFALLGFTLAAILTGITLPTAVCWTLERRKLLERAAVEQDGAAFANRSERLWLRALLSRRTAIGVILSFLVIYWVSLSVDDESFNPLDRAFLKWYIAFAVCMVVFLCVHVLMRGFSTLVNEPVFLVAIGSLILLVPFLIFSSAVNILPVLPEQVGGAREKQVSILVGTDDVAGLKSIGITFGEQTTLSRPLTMLFEGTTVYVFRVDDRRIVQVDKRLVKAVIVEPNTR